MTGATTTAPAAGPRQTPPHAATRLSPTAFDAFLAAVVFFGCAGLNSQAYQGPPAPLILQVALALPLAWRRRAPLTVFYAIAAVALVQWLADIQLLTDVALLIALYTVAAHSTWRHTLMAAAVLETGILLASVRWAAPHGSFLNSLVFLTAVAVAVAVTGVNTRIRRAHLAALHDRAARLERERDQRARLAAANERARIAREMHDIVTHNLSVMVALADGAVFAQHRSPDKTTAALHQISGTGRQALTDMRRSLGVLRAGEPDALRHPMPGIAQLAALTDQMRAAGLPTRLDLRGDPTCVSAAAQLTLYRLTQEALTNTLKHAPPGTRAEVRIHCSPDTLTLEVTDDGPAARTPAPVGRTPGPPGHGIPGMRERAAAYGGTLHAGPLPGRGWRVRATLHTDPVAEDTP
ncbi:signal transduction histidine kinase [Streptosporangium becharense]|uniref:histidine kinase n=1 Tax=Streptosporangium becharense TaxID=1816182 RepID=A0A7W9MK22_9ACTN|nr:histidine kinase [Streptosporangium becharense]MBB2914308.1 signal transduction histidine kinase [Streptosporangium becharense]MBB5823660.1 signal transduction histidine kinase [Streptosporangium becharense]